MNLNFNDFQKQDIKFDILKLRKAYNDILKIKNFTAPDGVSLINCFANVGPLK